MRYNTRLVEEFGHLERLCSDLYNEKHGVTVYINDMMSKKDKASRLVSNWDYDYMYLKKVRNMRNKLSHGEVSFDIPYATEDDISFVVNFKERILSQTDPLAVYRKALLNTKPKKSTKTQSSYAPNRSSSNKAPRHPVGCAIFAIGALTIIAIVTIIYIFL